MKRSPKASPSSFRITDNAASGIESDSNSNDGVDRAAPGAGAGNTGRAHDLETDRRIDEFRARRDGAALSQRARR